MQRADRKVEKCATKVGMHLVSFFFYHQFEHHEQFLLADKFVPIDIVNVEDNCKPYVITARLRG